MASSQRRQRDFIQALVDFHDLDLVREFRPATLYGSVLESSSPGLFRLPVAHNDVVGLTIPIQPVSAVACGIKCGEQVPDGLQGGFFLSRQCLVDSHRKNFLCHYFWRALPRAIFLASSAVTTCKRIKFVDPEARCVPATTPSTSPTWTRPRSNNSCSAAITMSSEEPTCFR